MLKELFIKLQHHKKEFTKEEIEKLEEFKNDGFVFFNNENYELNSKYRIGIIRVEKNRAILEDLSNEHKNLPLDFEHLNGAYDGDLILAKRVFNPRSKIKAKVVKVFNSHGKNILVYVKDGNYFTVKEAIMLQNKTNIEANDGDILLIDNKTFSVVENIGNIHDAKVDEKNLIDTLWGRL